MPPRSWQCLRCRRGGLRRQVSLGSRRNDWPSFFSKCLGFTTKYSRTRNLSLVRGRSFGPRIVAPKVNSSTPVEVILRNGSRYTEPTIEASFVNDSVKVWSTSKGAFVLSSLEAIASAGLLGAFNKLARMVSVALLSLSSALKVAPLGYAETRTVFYDRGYDSR